MRGTVAVVLVVGTLSCGGGEFLCSRDHECSGSADGVCVQGYCAFPDDTCPSGLRFGEHSGGLSGRCVDEDGGTGPGTSGTSGTATATTMTTSSPSGSQTSSPTPTTTPATSETGDPSGDVEFTDDDEADFSGGTFSDVEYAGERVRLVSGETSGQFQSRVFDAGADARWQLLSWRPDAPYAKALPDNGGAESGYAEGKRRHGGELRAVPLRRAGGARAGHDHRRWVGAW